MNYDEVIEGVEDFQRGASRRRDDYVEGSPNHQFFDGKVEGYEDVLAWLRSEKLYAEKQARRLDKRAEVE